jgi:hypothetical protein
VDNCSDLLKFEIDNEAHHRRTFTRSTLLVHGGLQL